MIIVRPRYIVNEYSWEVKGPQRPSDVTETILTVSFDHATQRLFSSARISVTHNKNVSTETVVGEWKFASLATASVLPFATHIDPVSSESVPLETQYVRPNPSSLPILEINFEIESIIFVPEVWDVSLNSREIGTGIPSPRGALTFKNSRDQPHQTLLEVNQSLTADTQSVSASFTCSPLLYTPGQHGSGLPLDNSSTVGRVVHIRPAILEHKSVLLPTEILLMIFRNFSESSDINSRWRRDLLFCGLVCKQWTCALDLELLLSDFHHPEALTRQKRYPPEISSFANALTSYPSLALSITHLSPDYFLKHPLWKTLPDSFTPSQFQLKPRMPSLVVTRNKQFIASFLSILRLAKNLRFLSLSSRWNISLPDEFIDALRGLDKVEEVDVAGGFNTVHQAYLATWSSLKHIRILITEPDGIEPVPETPPRYALVDANLSATVRDEYLNYMLSASSSSLKRLVLEVPFGLTNAGLHSALLSVSNCLVSLQIGRGPGGPGGGPGKDEERALDSLIAQMVCLEYLEIPTIMATRLMIERRSEAFQQSRALWSLTALPIINLKLLITLTNPQTLRKNSLVVAASQVWPGWAIGMYDTSN